MNFEEFKECFEKLKSNLDKFIKEMDENNEKIKIYLSMSEQVIEKLKEQEKELNKFRNSNILEVWKKHILENKRYGYEELAEEIEAKLKEFDERLRKDIEEFEEEREKILKANKKV